MRDVSAGTMGDTVCWSCGDMINRHSIFYRWREDEGLVMFYTAECECLMTSEHEVLEVNE